MSHRTTTATTTTTTSPGRRFARRTLAVCLAVGLTGIAACSSDDGDEAAEPTVTQARQTTTTERATTTTAKPTTTTAAPTTTTTAVPVAPLTGLPIGNPLLFFRPALAVKLDNHRTARPHAGLNQADVVYEEIVEANITRFFAVFHSTDAAPIGPIRSARTTDVDLLNQLNRPLFAWSGGNANVVRAIGSANALSRAHGQAPGYYRDGERRRRADLEHTLMNESTAAIWSTTEPGQTAPPALFQYRKPGQAVTGTPATRVAMQLRSVDVGWTWDAPSKSYVRSEYGDAHLDASGAPVSAHNIVVQFVDYRSSPADRRSPEAVTVGEGAAWVFTGGKIIPGTWERPDPSQPATLLDAKGKPILLTPGRTWVELAEANVSPVLFA
jgi:hypothetical protein